MQKVMLIGYLGRDPEVKYSQQGMAIPQFSVATTERWNDKEGKLQEYTEWFAVKAFNRLAEIAGEHLHKAPAFTWRAAKGQSHGTTSRRAESNLEISYTSTGLSFWIPRAAGTASGSPPKAPATKQR